MILNNAVLCALNGPTIIKIYIMLQMFRTAWWGISGAMALNAVWRLNRNIWGQTLSVRRINWNMSSSWQPNPNAKPFVPASAFFTLPIPCAKIRIRKKGIFSRMIQWILVIVLCVTVIINFIFIWDTTKKYSRDRTVLNSNTADEGVGISNHNENKGTV